MGVRVTTEIQDTDYDEGGSVSTFINENTALEGCVPANPSPCDDTDTPSYQLEKGFKIPTFTCLDSYDAFSDLISTTSLTIRYSVSDSVDACSQYNPDTFVEGQILPFHAVATVVVYYHDVPDQPTVSFDCAGGGALNLTVDWPSGNGRPLTSFTVTTSDGIPVSTEQLIAAGGDPLADAASLLVSKQRMNAEAETVVMKSSGAAQVATCPDGMSIAVGYALHISSASSVDYPCIVENNKQCVAQDTFCTQTECVTDGDDAMMIFLFCQFHVDDVSTSTSTSAVFYESNDLVLETGNHASMTTSCPPGKSIVSGFGFQTSSGVAHQDSCIADMKKACPRGATSCSLSACDTTGDDLKVIFVVCSSEVFTEDTYVLSEDGDASCPTNMAIAMGMGVNLFTTPSHVPDVEELLEVSSVDVQLYVDTVNSYSSLYDATDGALPSELLSVSAGDLTLAYSFEHIVSTIPGVLVSPSSATVVLHGICESAADVGMSVVSSDVGITVNLCNGTHIDTAAFAVVMEGNVFQHVTVTLAQSGDSRNVTVYLNDAVIGSSLVAVSGALYAADGGYGLVFGLQVAASDANAATRDEAAAMGRGGFQGVLYGVSLSHQASSAESVIADYSQPPAFAVALTSNSVSYGASSAACQAMGGRLATLEQVGYAWSQGFYSCSAAWVGSGNGDPALTAMPVHDNSLCNNGVSNTVEVSSVDQRSDSTAYPAMCFVGDYSAVNSVTLIPEGFQGIVSSNNSYFNTMCNAGVVDAAEQCGTGTVFNGFSDVRFQSVYTADELYAAGLRAGSYIGGVTLRVADLPSAGVDNLEIRVGFSSSVSDFGDKTYVDAADLINVYGPLSIGSTDFYEDQPKTFLFAAPVVWADASTNMILEVSHSAPSLSAGTSGRGASTMKLLFERARSVTTLANGTVASFPGVLDIVLESVTDVMDAACVLDSLTACELGDSSCALPACRGAENSLLYLVCVPDSHVNARSVVTVGGLTADTFYTLVVSATNDIGTGALSEAGTYHTSSVNVAGAPLDYQLAVTSGGALSASWTTPSDDGGSEILGYQLSLLEATSNGAPAVVSDGLEVNLNAADVASYDLDGDGNWYDTANGHVAMWEAYDGLLRDMFSMAGGGSFHVNGNPAGAEILVPDFDLTSMERTYEVVMAISELDTVQKRGLIGDRRLQLTSQMVADTFVADEFTHFVAVWDGVDPVPTVYVNNETVSAAQVTEAVNFVPPTVVDYALLLLPLQEVDEVLEVYSTTFRTGNNLPDAGLIHSYTIEFWFYLPSYDATMPATVLLSDDGSHPVTMVLEVLPAQGVVQVRVSDNDAGVILPLASNVILTSSPISDLSEWTHVAVTHSQEAGTIQLVVNGVSESVRETHPFDVYFSTSYTFYPVSTGAVYDDVRVWNVARTAAQVATYLDSPVGGNCLYCGEVGLVAMYSFDFPGDHVTALGRVFLSDLCEVSNTAVGKGNFGVVPVVSGSNGLESITCDITDPNGLVVGDDGISGYVSVARVYSRALSEAEVSNNFEIFVATTGLGAVVSSAEEEEHSEMEVLFQNDFTTGADEWTGLWNLYGNANQEEDLETWWVCSAGPDAAGAIGPYVISSDLADGVPVYYHVTEEQTTTLFAIFREFGVWYLREVLSGDNYYFNIIPDVDQPPLDSWWASSVTALDLEPAITLSPQCFIEGDYIAYTDGRSLCGDSNAVLGPLGFGAMAQLNLTIENNGENFEGAIMSFDVLLSGAWADETMAVWNGLGDTLLHSSAFTTANVLASTDFADDTGVTFTGADNEVVYTSTSGTGQTVDGKVGLMLERAVNTSVTPVEGLFVPLGDIPTRVSVVTWSARTSSSDVASSCTALNQGPFAGDNTVQAVVSVCFTREGLTFSSSETSVVGSPFNVNTWYELRVELDWYTHTASLILSNEVIAAVGFCPTCVGISDVRATVIEAGAQSHWSQLRVYDSSTSNGVVGRWSFDTEPVSDTDGNSVVGDISGMGLLSVLYGNAAWVDEEIEGSFGARVGRGSLSFDMTGSGEAGGASVSSFYRRYPVESRMAWVQPVATQHGDVSVLSFGSETTSAASFFGLDSTNHVTFWERDADGITTFSLTTSANITADSLWELVVLTVDADLASIYINGELSASMSMVNITLQDTSALDSLTIGALIDQGTMVKGMTGKVDDVFLFNYALTATEAAGYHVGGTVCNSVVETVSMELPMEIFLGDVFFTHRVSFARGLYGPTLSLDNLVVSGSARSCYSEELRDVGYVMNVVESVDAQTFSQIVAGLTKETTYSVALQALNKIGAGVATTLDGTTSSPTSPGQPAAPYTTKLTGGLIEVAWDPPSDTGGVDITGYELVSCSDDTCATMTTVYDGFGSTNTRFVIGGLTASTQFILKVRAYNTIYNEATGLGISPYSDKLSDFTDQATPPGATASPVLLKRSGGMMTVAWSAPEDNGGITLTGYTLYMSGNGASTSFDVSGSTTQTFDVTGLDSYSPYTFYVVSVNAAFFCLADGESSPTSEFTTTTPTPPAAPAAPVIVSRTGGSITLSWTDPEDIGGLPVTGYKVYMRTAAGEGVEAGEYELSYDGVDNTAQTYVQYGLLAVTSYEFKVLALNFMTYADNALALTTSSSEVTSTSSIEFSGESFTLEMWLNVEEYKSSADTLLFSVDANDVVSPYNNSLLTVASTSLSMLSDGTLHWDVTYDNITVSLNPTDKLPLMAWVHVALVVDVVDDEGKLYLDGVMVSSGTMQTFPASSAAVLSFGADFGGLVDDVRVWSVDRSESEIRAELSTRIDAPADYAQLTHQFTFDDVASYVVTEVEGYGSAATPTLTLGAGDVVGESQRGYGDLSASNVVDSGALSTPSVPLDLAQTTSTGGSVTLAWEAPENTGGVANSGLSYKVSLVGSTDALYFGSSLFVKLNGLTANTQYNYYVTASHSNNVYVSGASTALTASTGALSLSDPPTGLALCTFSSAGWCYTVASTSCSLTSGIDQPPCVPSGGSIGIVWTAPKDTGGSSLVSFKLFYGIEGGDFTEVKLDDAILSYQALSLSAATTYQFYASAVNSLGDSADSSIFTVTTTAQSKPSAPVTFVEGSATEAGALSFQWTVPIDNGGAALVGYALYELTASGTRANCANGQSGCTKVMDVDNVLQLQNLYTSKSTGTPVSVLAGTTYRFVLAARNDQYTGTLSSVLSITTPAAVVPAAPSAPSNVETKENEMKVLCPYPANTGGAAVTALYLYQDGVQMSTDSITTTSTSGVVYHITGLKVDTVYAYVCSAVNSVGEGATSESVDISTQSGNPGTPEFRVSAVTVIEGEGVVAIELTRTGGVSGDITASVSFVTDGSTGSVPDDIKFSTEAGETIEETSTTVDFVDQSSSATIYVFVVDDAIFESPSEEVVLQVSFNGAITSTLTITIDGNGDAGFIGFVDLAYEVVENAGTVTLFLERTGGSSSAVTIAYATAGITAVEDADYVGATGQVSFADGVTEGSFSITITNDDVYDIGGETFSVTLSIPTGSNANLRSGSTVATVNIVDDGDISPPGAPATPTAPDTTVTGGALVLNFAHPVDTGGDGIAIQSMILYRSECATQDDDSSCFNEESVTVSANILTYYFTDMIANTPYRFQVAAVNAATAVVGTRSSSLWVRMKTISSPTVPRSLKMDSSTGGSITLSWQAPLDKGGAALISYTLVVVENGEQIPLDRSTELLSTTYTHYGLTSNTEYIYRVLASNSAKTGAQTTSLVVSTTDPTLASAPRELQDGVGTELYDSTGGAISVLALAPLDTGGVGITGYRLFYRTVDDNGSPTSQFQLTAEGEADVLDSVWYTLRSEGLVALTAYEFVMQGINSVDSIALFSCSATPNSVQLRDCVDSAGASVVPNTFVVAGDSVTIGGEYKFVASATTTTIVLEDVYYGSAAGSVQVALVNELSSIVSLETTVPTTPAQAPVPTVIRVTGGMVELMVYDPKDTGGVPITGFDIYMISVTSDDDTHLFTLSTDGLENVDSFGSSVYLTGTIVSETLKEISQADLKPLYDYQFSAVALNIISSCESGTEPVYSEYLAVSTEEMSLPSVPLNVAQVSSTGGSITVDWDRPLDIGGGTILNYQLYYAPWNPDGEYPASELVFAYQGLTMQYQVTLDLVASSTYAFFVRAENEVGYSDLTGESLASTADPSPALQASIYDYFNATGGTITFYWKAPSDTGGIPITGFYLERNQGPGTNYIDINNGDPVSADLRSYTVSGLFAERVYSFRLAVANEFYIGDVSDIASFETLPPTTPGVGTTPVEESITGGASTFILCPALELGGVEFSNSGYQLELDGLVVLNISFYGVIVDGVGDAYNFIGSDSAARRRLFGSPLPQEVGVDELGGSYGLGMVEEMPMTMVSPLNPRVRVTPYQVLSAGPHGRMLAEDAVTSNYVTATGCVTVEYGGLEPETQYSFVSYSTNGAGVGAASLAYVAETTVATVPGAPDAPVKVSSTGGRIVLQWTAPNDVGGSQLTHYILHYRKAIDTQWIEIDGVGLEVSYIHNKLEASTEYVYQVTGVNEVGSGEASPTVSISTTVKTTAGSPERPTLLRRATTWLEVDFLPPGDFGGDEVLLGYRVFYSSSVSSSFNPTASDYGGYTLSNTDTLIAYVGEDSEASYTIEGLDPDTEYYVVAAAVNSQGLGSGSAERRAVTSSLDARPLAPSIGCVSLSSVEVFWESPGVFEDREFIDYTVGYEASWLESDGITTGTASGNLTADATGFAAKHPIDFGVGGTDVSVTYSVRATELITATGVERLGPVSNAVIVDLPSNENVTLCYALSNVVSTLDLGYSPHADLEWHITPSAENPFETLVVTFTTFDMECDHDYIIVEEVSFATGEVTQIWRGGCYRPQFVLSTSDWENTIIIRLRSDGAWQGSGFELTYEVDGIGTPSLSCPGVTACSGRGQCSSDTCVCNTGYIGESCGGQTVCARYPSLCANPENVVVVSTAFGSDDEDVTGALGDATAATGTQPKAIKTLSTAFARAKEGDTVLVMSSGSTESYFGEGNCGVVIDKSITVLSLLGSSKTYFTCTGGDHSKPIMSVAGAGVAPTIQGITFRYGSANQGAALSVSDGADVFVKNSVFTSNNALVSGGAVHVNGASLSLNSVNIHTNSAQFGGGGILLEDSDLTLTSSHIYLNTVPGSSESEGGAIMASGVSTITGVTSARLYSNTAPKGAAISASGSLTLTNVDLETNNGEYGGAMYAYGASTEVVISDLTVSGNTALYHGGGFYVTSGATVTLGTTTVVGNTAETGAGAYLMESGSTLQADSVSDTNTYIMDNVASVAGGGVAMSSADALNKLTVTSNTAPLGGGVFVTGGSPTLADTTISSNTAETSTAGDGKGGGLLVDDSASVTLSNILISDNNADYGGGVYLMGRSTIEADIATAIDSNSASTEGGCAYLLDAAAMTGVVMDGCNAPTGGGVVVNSGATALTDVEVTSCSATGGNGGGLMVTGGAVVTFSDTAVSQCSATEIGGGAYLDESSQLLGSSDSQRLTVSDCSAVVSGGGIAGVGDVVVRRVEVNQCNSEEGGGMYFDTGAPVLRDSLIQLNNADRYGGGVLLRDTTGMVIRDVEVSNNDATVSGGGIFMASSVAQHDGVTVTGNGRSERGGNLALYSSSLVGTNSASRARLLAESLNSGVTVLAPAGMQSVVLSGEVADLQVDQGGNVLLVQSALGDVELTGGSAYEGGGVFVGLDQTGIVDATTTDSSALTNVLISANDAVFGGGVHVAEGATLVSTQVQVSDNVATSQGGGFSLNNGIVQHRDVSVHSNNAAQGGGLAITTFGHFVAQGEFDSALAGSGPAGQGVADANMLSNIEDNVIHGGGSDYNGAGVYVQNGAVFELSGLAVVKSGSAQRGGGLYVEMLAEGAVSHVRFAGHNVVAMGGGVYQARGTKVMYHHVSNQNNTAYGTSTIGFGGGFALIGSDGVVPNATLYSCDVSDNTAETSGGAAYLDIAELAAFATSMDRNTALGFVAGEGFIQNAGDGGGIYGSKSDVTLHGVTMTSNFAETNVGEGGSMYLVDCDTVISESTLDGGNSYTSNIRPLPVKNSQKGGVMMIQGGSLDMSDSIVKNGAASEGGCIYLFSSKVDVVNSVVQGGRSDDFGGGVFVTDSAAGVTFTDSEFSANGAFYDGGALYNRGALLALVNCELFANEVDDRGGSIFLDTSAVLTTDDTTFDSNVAIGFGVGVYVSRGADYTATRTTFSNNGLTSESDGGGAIFCTDTTVYVYDSIFTNNHASFGGSVYVDRDGFVVMDGSTLTGNTAGTGGAFYMLSRADVTISNTEFTQNAVTLRGGAIYADEQTEARLSDVTLTENTAVFGAGIYLQEEAVLTMVTTTLVSNQASEAGGGIYLDGTSVCSISDTEFTTNSASLYGGAVYSSHTTGVGLGPDLLFDSNSAIVGGGIWWWYSRQPGVTETTSVGYDEGDVLECTSCTFTNQVGNDWGTNSMRTGLGWFGHLLDGVAQVQSGVPMYEDETLEATLQTNSPHVLALDLYFQVALLDATTTCLLTSPEADAGELKSYNPSDSAVTSNGVVPFLGLVIKGDIRQATYTVQAQCDTSIGKVPDSTLQMSIVNCDPGYALENSVCTRCASGKYSPVGRACMACPQFADCVQERCLETDSANLESADCGTIVPYGVPYPTSQQGQIFYDLRGSVRAGCDTAGCGTCCRAADNPGETADEREERIYQCILQQGRFSEEDPLSWSADKIHYCLTRHEVYECPVLEACNPGVTIPRAFNESCKVGYGGVLCAVCEPGFTRETTNLCSPCPLLDADGNVRTGDLEVLYAVFFTIIILFVWGLIYIYMYNRTEKRLMTRSKAMVRGRVLDEITKTSRNPITRFFNSKIQDWHERKEEKRRLATVFGVERKTLDGVSLWLRPEKVKILLGFGQIFASFKESYDILWPPSVESQMDSFSSWNLDVVKVAGVDCVVTTDFYDTFTFMIVAMICIVAFILSIYLYGVRRYRRLLRAIPRGCINCGLPVREKLPRAKRVGGTKRMIREMSKHMRRKIARMKKERERKRRRKAKEQKMKKLEVARNIATTSAVPTTASQRALKLEHSGSKSTLERVGSQSGNLIDDNGPPRDHAGSAASVSSMSSEGSLFSSQGSLRSRSSSLEQEIAMREAMYGHDTSELDAYGSVHTRCPTSRRVTDRRALRALLKSNLQLWKARIKLRINFRTYQNKALKLLFWLLLLGYPPVSSVILRIFKCAEVGAENYLTEDYRLVCWNSEHWAYVSMGMGAVLGFIVGVPFIFWMLLFLARNRGVEERWEMLNTPLYKEKKVQYMGVVEQDYHERGERFLDPLPGSELEEKMLKGFFKRRNLQDHKTRNRLGFIYHSYEDAFWWYEIVEMTRKLLLNGCIVFFEEGTVKQLLGGLSVCYIALCLVLYIKPYHDFGDNLVAGVVLFQLFLTLFVGLLLSMDIHLDPDGISRGTIGGIIIVTNVFSVTFALGMIIWEKMVAVRDARSAMRQSQNVRIKVATRRAWRRALFKIRIVLRTVKSDRGHLHTEMLEEGITDADIARVAAENPFFAMEQSLHGGGSAKKRRRGSLGPEVGEGDEKPVGIAFQRLLFAKIENPLDRARLLNRIKHHKPGSMIKVGELKEVADHQLIMDTLVEEEAREAEEKARRHAEAIEMDAVAKQRVEKRVRRRSLEALTKDHKDDPDDDDEEGGNGLVAGAGARRRRRRSSAATAGVPSSRNMVPSASTAHLYAQAQQMDDDSGKEDDNQEGGLQLAGRGLSERRPSMMDIAREAQAKHASMNAGGEGKDDDDEGGDEFQVDESRPAAVVDGEQDQDDGTDPRHNMRRTTVGQGGMIVTNEFVL